jgi:hypothetical protein
MKSSLDEVLTVVWRQALVENADFVKLGAERYPVTTSKAKRLRQVAFVFDGNTTMGIEQNPKNQITMGSDGSLRQAGEAIYSGWPVGGCCSGWESNYLRQTDRTKSLRRWSPDSRVFALNHPFSLATTVISKWRIFR